MKKGHKHKHKHASTNDHSWLKDEELQATVVCVIDICTKSAWLE